MPHWHWTVCKKSMRSGGSPRIATEVSNSRCWWRVRVSWAKSSAMTSRLLDVAVRAQPRLQRLFQDVEDGVRRLAAELPLQRRPLQRRGEVAANTRRQRHAADCVAVLPLPVRFPGRRRIARPGRLARIGLVTEDEPF